jgi:hypothetical protein
MVIEAVFNEADQFVIKLVGSKVLKEPDSIYATFERLKEQETFGIVIENVDEILAGLRSHAGSWHRLLDELRRPTVARTIFCTARRPESLKPEEIEAFTYVMPLLYLDERGRLEILKVNARHHTLHRSVSLEDIASRTEWWSGEELANLFKHAAARGAPTKESFNKAMESVGAHVVVEARKERTAELLKFTMKHCTSRAIREQTFTKFSALLDGVEPQKLRSVPNIVVESGGQFTQIIKEQIMNDQYKTGDVYGGIVGGHVHDVNFTQSWNQLRTSVDLPVLAEQLSQLREELLKRAADAEHHAAIGAVASAEIEARKGDGPKALEYLSRAGKWALDVATQIGVRVAAAAITGTLANK